MIHMYQSKDGEPMKGSARKRLFHMKIKYGKYAWLRFKTTYHLGLQRMPLANCLVSLTVPSLATRPPLPEPTWNRAIF
jgi:hypothetical protein